ncbi:hypothetical protein Ancab_029537 [Ancistrocladus abbreviatus]
MTSILNTEQDQEKKRQRRNENMEDIGLLNTDVSINILSRLPTKTLIQLKCVSKGWQRLISDPDFIKVQTRSTQPISGFFFQEKFQWCDDDIERVIYIQLGVQGAKLHQTVLDFLPEKVVIFTSSDGLLCCRSCMPTSKPVLYVCNPTTKEWLTLNWDVLNKRDCIGLAFDPTSQDCRNIPRNFKLVRVHLEENLETTKGYFSFDIYNSESRAWMKSKEICSCDDYLCKNKCAFAGGILYWLTEGDQILMFDVKNEFSSLISLPLPTIDKEKVAEYCVGESNGQLHCITVSEDGLLVWALEDYLESKWQLRWLKKLSEMEEQNPEFLYNLTERVAVQTKDMFPWMIPLAFKDGLVIMKISSELYSYQIHTRKMEKLCSFAMLVNNSMLGPTVLPYSLSLVSPAQL